MSIAGETPQSMQFSTMSRMEAEIFAPSSSPEEELRELYASIESHRFRAHMRIAGILSHGPRNKLGSVRRHFAYALTEAELQLFEEAPLDQDPTSSSGSLESSLEDVCGIFCYCLGEVCEIIGRSAEAKIHYERGVRYYNANCSMKLALYEKQAGRFEQAQHLLTSATDEPDMDVEYLLGDLFHARSDLRAAREHFDLAAEMGQHRAEQRRRELAEVPGDGVDSGSTETIDLSHGWTAFIDNLDGGIYVQFCDKDVQQFQGHSMLGFVDGRFEYGEGDRLNELEEHRQLVADIKDRTFTYRNGAKSGLVQIQAEHTLKTSVFEAVGNPESGEVEFRSYKNLSELLRRFGSSVPS